MGSLNKTPILALTPTQKRMYRSEKGTNFRWLAKVFATRSTYVLTAEDRVSAELAKELDEIGQFAEVAYGFVPVQGLFDSYYDILSQPGFPLEAHHALRGCQLISVVNGTLAGLRGAVIYRPDMRQLVVGFCGTTNLKTALHDLRALFRSHPRRPREENARAKVHSGFWALYQGICQPAIDAIKSAQGSCNIKEIVFTGHSLGGAIAYLLALDVLASSDLLPRERGIIVKIVTFGSPRVGNDALCRVWGEVVEDYESAVGQDTVREYSIKGYNDGVPSLPPFNFGYRHFSKTSYYLAHGHIYRIPPEESEHGSFTISDTERDGGEILFPRGGHNYYGRNMEAQARRLQLFMDAKPDTAGWKKRYEAQLAKAEMT